MNGNACLSEPPDCAIAKSERCWAFQLRQSLIRWPGLSESWQENAMCEFSEKLIAWLDQELAAEDAANVARHIDICAECRTQVAAYRQVSETIEAYCDAALACKAKHRAS